MNRRVFALTALFGFMSALLPAFAAAAAIPVTVVPSDCNGIGGCHSVCDLATLAQNILNVAIYLAVFLSAILFAWAGFLYLTNVANTSQHSRAVEVFRNVAIGLIIILVSWLLVDVLMRAMLGSSVLPWNAIC